MAGRSPQALVTHLPRMPPAGWRWGQGQGQGPLRGRGPSGGIPGLATWTSGV